MWRGTVKILEHFYAVWGFRFVPVRCRGIVILRTHQVGIGLARGQRRYLYLNCTQAGLFLLLEWPELPLLITTQCLEPSATNLVTSQHNFFRRFIRREGCLREGPRESLFDNILLLFIDFLSIVAVFQRREGWAVFLQRIRFNFDILHHARDCWLQ